GKSELTLPHAIGKAIRELIESVTADWHKQRRREERESSARAGREDRLARREKVSIKDAAWEVMEEAYLAASGGGKLPVKARQIMYAARPGILKLTGKDVLSDAYFTQTLLVDSSTSIPSVTSGMWFGMLAATSASRILA